MSNLNPESLSEDHDPNKTTHSQTASAANPGKKKSGFQITSVTDSGHGRPVSIMRDGEESADDLDESHASYSDVSYSRTTDADHDQESTASEDTLNISSHDAANIIHGDGSVSNHLSAIHHSHHMHHAQPSVIAQVHDAPGKARMPKDLALELKKSEHVHNVASTIPKSSFAKQQSEHLDSPQELPHDNIPSEVAKSKKFENPDKTVEVPQGPSVKFLLPSESEQNVPPATVSPNPPTAASQPIASSAAGDSTEPAATERPIVLSTAATAAPSSTTTTTKPVSVSSTITGIKARVYKVVKREATQPSRRARGRWKWYDFTDTQTPLTGPSYTTSSEERTFNESGSLQTFTYTNTLMSTGVVPYALQRSDSASSLFIKDQLLSAGLSSNSSTRHTGVDELKTAILTGGDSSAPTKTPKIDNKIEAAMDLVKKHLMLAVRDEVDELKEKIKDLITENAQLKSENTELRAAIPSDTAPQVQLNQPSLKELSAKENQPIGDQVKNSNATEGAITQSNTQHSMDLMQKGASISSPPQDGSASNMDAPRATVGTKSTPEVGQSVLSGQGHMHASQAPPLPHGAQPQSVELHTHEHGQLPAQETSKPDVKTKDADFDKKNPP